MAHYNIFISQPFHGKSEREILEERDRIEEVLHKLFPEDELEFLSGYRSEMPVIPDDETRNRVYGLGRSISLMAESDYVFFNHEWVMANGCYIESAICNRYSIPAIYERIRNGQASYDICGLNRQKWEEVE